MSIDLDDFVNLKISEPRVGSEDSAWATLRGHLSDAQCHIQRFEDKLSTGIPDSNICYKGKEFWFEGKFLRAYPKRMSSLVKVGLKIEQCNWLKQRSDLGARCYVWIREPAGWKLVSNHFDCLRDGMTLTKWKTFGRDFVTSKALVNTILEEL